jgi:hypothetical protein
MPKIYSEFKREARIKELMTDQPIAQRPAFETNRAYHRGLKNLH